MALLSPYIDILLSEILLPDAKKMWLFFPNISIILFEKTTSEKSNRLPFSNSFFSSESCVIFIIFFYLSYFFLTFSAEIINFSPNSIYVTELYKEIASAFSLTKYRHFSPIILFSISGFGNS